MICSNCGAQNAAGSSFCTNCGKPLTNNEVKYDPNTGQPITSNINNTANAGNTSSVGSTFNVNQGNSANVDPVTGMPIGDENTKAAQTLQKLENITSTVGKFTGIETHTEGDRIVRTRRRIGEPDVNISTTYTDKGFLPGFITVCVILAVMAVGIIIVKKVVPVEETSTSSDTATTATSGKMVCESSEGTVTIEYEDDELTGFYTTGSYTSLSSDYQRSYSEMIGIDAYLDEIEETFDDDNGTCTRK